MSGIMLACVAASGGSSGGGGGSLSLPAFVDVYDLQPAPGFAQAQISLTNAGVFQALTSTGSYNEPPWLVPGTNAADYEVLATLVSGTLSSGTTGSWLGLGTTRTWDVSNTYLGSDVQEAAAVFNLGIRAVGGSTILASCDVYLTATVGVLR